MTTYAFSNNKGALVRPACASKFDALRAPDPDERILALDACPQANLWESLYGGQAFKRSETLFARQGEPTRRTIGGYFESRLSSPYAQATIAAAHYISKPYGYNPSIPKNIDLIARDPLLEMQATAMSALANTTIPTTNSWLRIIDWITDLLGVIWDDYDTGREHGTSPDRP